MSHPTDYRLDDLPDLPVERLFAISYGDMHNLFVKGDTREVARKIVKKYTQCEEGRELLVKHKGELAKLLIAANVGTAEPIADALLQCKEGRHLLADTEHFLNDKGKREKPWINGAAAQYLARGMEESDYRESGAKVMAHAKGRLAYALFEKNDSGTALHIAKLLAATDKGIHVLHHKHGFETPFSRFRSTLGEELVKANRDCSMYIRPKTKLQGEPQAQSLEPKSDKRHR